MQLIVPFIVPFITFLGSVGGAVGGALIGAVLTPSMQQRNWVRQQRFELRKEILNRLHTLSGTLFEYLGPDWATGELTGAHERDRDTALEDKLAREWRVIVDQATFLFSKDASNRLTKLDSQLRRVLLRPLPDPPERGYEVWDNFISERRLAFEALYEDLLTPVRP